MGLDTLIFLFFFLPAFLLTYYLFPKEKRNYIIIGFGIIFYGFQSPIILIPFTLLGLLDYFGIAWIIKQEKKKILFNTLIAFNILTIFTLKIFNLGSNLSLVVYLLGLISFLMDYEKIEKINIKNFLTYIFMFPRVIGTSIITYKNIEKELDERNINYEQFSKGCLIFIQGLIKKVIIAGTLYFFWKTIYELPNIDKSITLIFLGLIILTLYIYFELISYCNMSEGIYKMMGFTYPKNFNFPLANTSINDFFENWYITLNNFISDYIYTPLEEHIKKIKKHRRIIISFITFLIIGLFLNININACLFAIYFTMLMEFENIFKKQKRKTPKIISHLKMYVLINLGFAIVYLSPKELFSYLMSTSTIINKTFIYYMYNYIIIIALGIFLSTKFSKNISLKLKSNILVLISQLIFYAIAFAITLALIISSTYIPKFIF